MLTYTLPSDKEHLRVGKNLPKNAIEILRYDFDKDNPILKTNNSSKDAIVSMDISSVQNKEEVRWIRIGGLTEKDDSLFKKDMEFDDGVYKGTLYRTSIDYKEYKKIVISEKDYIAKKNYKISEFNEETVLNSIPFSADTFSGDLFPESIKVVGKTTEEDKKTTITIVKPIFVGNFAGGTFPSISSSDLSNLTTMEVVTAIGATETKSSVISTSIWVSALANNVLPNEVIVDGKTFVYTGEYKEVTVETWVKHYGICRYWGGGGKSSNNYYGDPDYRFRVNGWTAKGYMNDKLPTPTLDRYGHRKNIECKHRPQKYPIDVGGFWTTNVGERAGIAWTYDIEEAAKYGGSKDSARGGVVWASNFTSSTFPPYGSDYLGSGHMPFVQGNNGTINGNGKVVSKNGAQKTSTAGFYNYGGWYCKWFRDIVLFYKGKTTTKRKEGYYNNLEVIHGGADLISVKSTFGYIKREIEKVIKGGCSELEIEVTYKGKLFRIDKTYSGIATYKGNVVKKYFLNDFDFTSEKNVVVSVGNNGFLEYENGSVGFKAQYIEITDYAVNGVPLYYKYECQNTIKINSEKEEIITEDAFVSIYSKNININHLTIANKVKGNTYRLTILLDRPIGIGDEVFADILTSDRKREKIYTTLLYKQGIDYKAIVSDDTSFLYKFGDFIDEKDTRRKIKVSFEIKTLSNTYTSNVYEGEVINKKYALASEMYSFIGNMMQVPIFDTNGEVLTVREIVARDTNTDIAFLEREKFYIQIKTSDGVVDAYTEEDGLSSVFIETLEDTGTLIDGEYTGMNFSYKCKLAKNKSIRNGFFIKNIDTGISIKVDENKPFKANFVKVSVSPFVLEGTKDSNEITATYPVISSDNYSPECGRPFVKTVERQKAIGRKVRLNKKALLDISKINVRAVNGTTKEIDYLCYKTNSIILKYPVNEDLLIEYLEIKDFIEYRGFNNGEVFNLLNINPFRGGEYFDVVSSSLKPTYELINKTIYIFIRPRKVALKSGEVLVNNTGDLIYHKISDPMPYDEFDSLIGIVYIPNDLTTNLFKTSTSSTIGGGVKEKYIKGNEKRLTSLHDVNEHIEMFIRKNSTVITTVDKEIVDEDSIKNLIDEHLPVGTLNLVKGGIK